MLSGCRSVMPSRMPLISSAVPFTPRCWALGSKQHSGQTIARISEAALNLYVHQAARAHGDGGVSGSSPINSETLARCTGPTRPLAALLFWNGQHLWMLLTARKPRLLLQFGIQSAFHGNERMTWNQLGPRFRFSPAWPESAKLKDTSCTSKDLRSYLTIPQQLPHAT